MDLHINSGQSVFIMYADCSMNIASLLKQNRVVTRVSEFNRKNDRDVLFVAEKIAKDFNLKLVLDDIEDYDPTNEPTSNSQIFWNLAVYYIAGREANISRNKTSIVDLEDSDLSERLQRYIRKAITKGLKTTDPKFHTILNYLQFLDQQLQLDRARYMDHRDVKRAFKYKWL